MQPHPCSRSSRLRQLPQPRHHRFWKCVSSDHHDLTIKDLFLQLTRGSQFAANCTEPIALSQVLRIGYRLIANTGLFIEACREWRKNRDTDKNMALFQELFTEAEQDRSSLRTTSSQAGYHAGNVTAAIPNTSFAPATAIPPLTEHTLAMARVQATADATQAQMATFIAAMKSQKLNRKNIKGTSYCWTHGHTTNSSRTSASCDKRTVTKSPQPRPTRWAAQTTSTVARNEGRLISPRLVLVPSETYLKYLKPKQIMPPPRQHPRLSLTQARPDTSLLPTRHSRTSAIPGITAQLPDGGTIHSMHTSSLNLPLLPAAAREAHIFPFLASGSLISIGLLCDHGCTTLFNACTVTVKYNDCIVLTGTRLLITRLWNLDVPSPAAAPPRSAANTPRSPAHPALPMLSSITQTWQHALFSTMHPCSHQLFLPGAQLSTPATSPVGQN